MIADKKTTKRPFCCREKLTCTSAWGTALREQSHVEDKQCSHYNFIWLHMKMIAGFVFFDLPHDLMRNAEGCVGLWMVSAMSDTGTELSMSILEQICAKTSFQDNQFGYALWVLNWLKAQRLQGCANLILKEINLWEPLRSFLHPFWLTLSLEDEECLSFNLMCMCFLCDCLLSSLHFLIDFVYIDVFNAAITLLF